MSQRHEMRHEKPLVIKTILNFTVYYSIFSNSLTAPKTFNCVQLTKIQTLEICLCGKFRHALRQKGQSDWLCPVNMKPASEFAPKTLTDIYRKRISWSKVLYGSV